MAGTSEATIVELLSAWAQGNAAVSEKVREHFADDCLWSQPGMPTTKGPEEAVTLISGLEAMGFTAIKIEFRNVSGDDDVVFTERVDDVLMADGTTAMSIAVVGVTEFRDGKITAWREYFDTAGLGTAAVG